MNKLSRLLSTSRSHNISHSHKRPRNLLNNSMVTLPIQRLHLRLRNS